MRNILVVEDNKNQALLYQNKLTEEGYIVSVAGSSMEAINMVEHNPPDLIVMDANVSWMENIEFMGKILGERIPVVINAAMVECTDMSGLKKTIREIMENESLMADK